MPTDNLLAAKPGIECRVVSIGALSAHPLWNERQAVRTGHATTTLVRTTAVDDPKTPVNLLIDPGLSGAFADRFARIAEEVALDAGARLPGQGRVPADPVEVEEAVWAQARGLAGA